MNFIKISATESTNSFLKDLSRREVLENFTVVVANHQLKGKGQMNAVWQSEMGKNLTFSLFVQLRNLDINDQFYLSKAVSVALSQVLISECDVKIKVKWPNDILADNFKIAGILIENNVKRAMITESIIGIGLNVNQTNFNNLPRASSLKKMCNQNFDLDELLKKIIDSIKPYIRLLDQNKFEIIDKLYFEHLFKNRIPSMYKDVLGNLFMGKIVNITHQGKLILELEDESLKNFDLKELEFIY